jgi:hypothetical protein
MPRGVRIKSKTIKSTLADADVQSMFQNIVGAGSSGDFAVVEPRSVDLEIVVKRVIAILRATANSTLLGKFEIARASISAYTNTIDDEFTKEFSAMENLDKYRDQIGMIVPDLVDKETQNKFVEQFAKLKKSSACNLIIATCNNLEVHKFFIGDIATLNPKFLTHSAGATFAPIEQLPVVNFKDIYISDLTTDSDKRFLMLILHKLYISTRAVYDLMMLPDVDIEAFSNFISESIEHARCQIPRCDRAFNKIASSVGMLKNNFNDYYGDFVCSNNPSVIMENFVVDVSRTGDTDVAMTVQFRKIISYFKKQVALQKNINPKLASVFDHVDRNFEEIDGRDADGNKRRVNRDADVSDPIAGTDIDDLGPIVDSHVEESEETPTTSTA